MVIKSEVINDIPRFFGILVAEFAAGGAVNLTLKMKRDMIIMKLDLEPKIDAMMRDFWKFCSPSLWKELIKETIDVVGTSGCHFRVLPKSVERASILHQSDGVGPQRHHIIPIGDLNGVSIALVARSGVISKSTDRIFISHGGQQKDLQNKGSKEKID
ncbi:hypothetical protein Tco_1020179 [Tanacetum coccineum]|uniref:Uncharacterized protein n=1 Tax=Tanacetum coccineum TaxID=301880 RepID=A0ABQ5FZQ0_9ASTR